MIEVKGLSKSFGATRVLDGVDLAIAVVIGTRSGISIHESRSRWI